MRAKYGYLLEDEDVKRWYENTARGSLITADVCLRRLGSFCESHKVTPKQFSALQEKELNDLILDYVSFAEKKGYAGNYINSTIKALKSWLAYNSRELKTKIKIKGIDETPSLKNERVPTLEEERRIFLSGDSKARTASVLIAHSGLRPKTLGNYQGDDGLTVGDFPELGIEGKTVTFSAIPTMIIVRKELSKAGHQYFTFLTEEGCGYLKDYLEERMRKGETLTKNSPIITPKFKGKPFIRTINIGDIIRGAIRQAGLPWRPYVLRSFFDTQLMLAESRRLILRDYRVFFMGHSGDIEMRYTTNRHKLSDAVISDMRKSYENSQEFLQTTKGRETSEEKIATAFKKQLLLVTGFKIDEIDKMNLLEISDSTLQELVKKKLMGQPTNGAKQRVVTVEEANKFLSQGWEFVAKLSDNKVVIKSS
jgi:hypothetical protein